jgi:hypothetical protein
MLSFSDFKPSVEPASAAQTVKQATYENVARDLGIPLPVLLAKMLSIGWIDSDGNPTAYALVNGWLKTEPRAA